MYIKIHPSVWPKIVHSGLCQCALPPRETRKHCVMNYEFNTAGTKNWNDKLRDRLRFIGPAASQDCPVARKLKMTGRDGKLSFYPTPECMATKSYRVKFAITVDVSDTETSDTFLNKESAVTLTRPGEYLKASPDSWMVKHHRARRPVRFLPLKNIGDWRVVCKKIISLKCFRAHTTAEVSRCVTA